LKLLLLFFHSSLIKKDSYLGAVSAFSFGLKLAPKMVEFYVERAAAHLALNNLHKAIEDTSQVSRKKCFFQCCRDKSAKKKWAKSGVCPRAKYQCR